MSLWDNKGTRPVYLTKEEKRNVIATTHGWVRRQIVGTRVKDEVLVTMADLANQTPMGNPDVVEVYVANTTGGTTIKRNLVNKVHVVYTEPLSYTSGTGGYTLSVANTAGGAAATATANTNKASITNANNTLTFTFTPTTAGTYKIQAQTITSNATIVRAYSVIGGTSETVNTSISAAVSNTLGTFTVA